MKLSAALLLSVILGTAAISALPSKVNAEICQPVNSLCAASDVVDTLKQKGPEQGMVKIVFANIGGNNLAFVVSENNQQGFFAVTIAEASYSEELSFDNVGAAITTFRLNYDGEVSNIVGQTDGIDSFVSLVGKAFAYGSTSITVPLEELK